MKKLLKTLFIIFILIFIIILYARYIGTYGFITKEYTIYNNNLPNSFDGIKIVHFSDIHYNRAISINKIKDIVKEINFINPDIVVFTGDLIDKDVNLTNKDYNDLIKVLSNIKAKYGKYAITGESDYKDNKKVINVFKESNFIYLDNDYDIIYSKENEKIFVGGVNTVSYDMDDIDKTMSYYNDNNNSNDYKIILVHEPDITDKIINNYDVDLILGGHSHNGQIIIPFIGAVCTKEYSKKYYDNYYKLDNTDLYISSGIGVSTVNYRLFNRPSINFYRINKEM